MPFRLWLRKTAEERLMMLHRRHIGAAKRSVVRELPLPETSSLQLAQGFLDAMPSPSAQFDRHELAALVRQAVAELPAIDREILLMRNVEGLTNQEAAQVLSITPATCSQRYGRALIRLQKRLARHGLEGTQP
jgi:RNA polymerase sigma-70 factor (ECF subfamily)